jgi:hypothetical protein
LQGYMLNGLADYKMELVPFAYEDINWDDPKSFVTPFPRRTGNTFADVCLNAWLDNLKLLPPNINRLVWTTLQGDLMTRVRRHCGSVSLLDALQNPLPNLNFLDRLRVGRELRNHVLEEDALWHKAAQVLRNDRFNDINPLKQNAANGEKWSVKLVELKDKYGSVQLKDMTQRAMYWLSVDQILPRPSPFRDRLSINHEVDWKWVDTQKLFMESSMMAFQWRSSHGKLFGRSDLYKFNYVADQICDLCGAEKQNIEHIYLQCPRIQSLFKNFERLF